jgi:hypothetical protein
MPVVMQMCTELDLQVLCFPNHSPLYPLLLQIVTCWNLKFIASRWMQLILCPRDMGLPSMWTQQEAEYQNQKNVGSAGDRGQMTGVTRKGDVKLEIGKRGHPSLRTVSTGSSRGQVTGVLERRRGHRHEEGGHGGLLLRTRVGKEAR